MDKSSKAAVPVISHRGIKKIADYGVGLITRNGSRGPAVSQSIIAKGCSQENANRLAACWNACEGMTIEALEKMPAPFSALLSQPFQEVVSQRDELVAAFEEVLRISDRDHDAWHRARAAITSVKGPQWKPHVWKTGGPGEGTSMPLLLDGRPAAVAAQAEFKDAASGPTIDDLKASGALIAADGIVSGENVTLSDAAFKKLHEIIEAEDGTQ